MYYTYTYDIRVRYVQKTKLWPNSKFTSSQVTAAMLYAHLELLLFFILLTTKPVFRTAMYYYYVLKRADNHRKVQRPLRTWVVKVLAKVHRLVKNIRVARRGHGGGRIEAQATHTQHTHTHNTTHHTQRRRCGFVGLAWNVCRLLGAWHRTPPNLLLSTPYILPTDDWSHLSSGDVGYG